MNDMATGHAPRQRNATDASGQEEIVAVILRALRAIEYGSVEITIHDSAVVQIERTEKVRFNKVGSVGAK